MATARRAVGRWGGTVVEEGAGVRLRRIFEFPDVERFDPFLMLDWFGTDHPDDYVAGFPWHPHRGIETVTSMLDGTVTHGDSMGNGGVINSGDIQWMTAGRGIIHQEMPRPYPGTMRGFQLWVNLPKTHKLMPPRYRGFTAAELPEVVLPSGARVRIIAGECGGTRGPVTELVVEALYLEVRLPPRVSFAHPAPREQTAFLLVVEGEVIVGGEGEPVRAGTVALLGDGETAAVAAGPAGARLLLVAGRPLREPIAWRGPIVMNTEAELDLAFRQYHDGTFLR